jgi:hypoxanthine phosphoribosyltransferase
MASILALLRGGVAVGDQLSIALHLSLDVLSHARSARPEKLFATTRRRSSCERRLRAPRHWLPDR